MEAQKAYLIIDLIFYVCDWLIPWLRWCRICINACLLPTINRRIHNCHAKATCLIANWSTIYIHVLFQTICLDIKCCIEIKIKLKRNRAVNKGNSIYTLTKLVHNTYYMF